MEEVETYVNEKHVIPGDVLRSPWIVWIHADHNHRKVLVQVNLCETNLLKIVLYLLHLVFGKMSTDTIRIQRFQLLMRGTL